MKAAVSLFVIALFSQLLGAPPRGAVTPSLVPIPISHEPVSANADPGGRQGPEANKTQPDDGVEFVNRSYRQGIVKAVTKTSITIQCPEWVGRRPVLGEDRVSRWQTVLIPAEPPKKFAVSEDLAAGEIPMAPRGNYRVFPTDMYRLTDVKVGDWVSIIYSRVNGLDTCDHICIDKRPGGRVPPLPEEAERIRLGPGPRWRKLPDHYLYHEQMNAYWDLVDKGIPYPEKFGRRRRFPVAPPPREFIPPIPPAIP